MRGRPVVRYAVAWLAAGTLVVAAALALRVDGGDDGGGAPAGLPPVEQPDLASAVRSAGCTLRVARAGDALNPPVDGRPSPRAPHPRVYDRPLPAADLVAALRRGIVVVQYRPGMPEEALRELRIVQAVLPKSVIVVPNGTRMPYAVAATAHRRLVGCTRYGRETRDAIRLFLGRYVGTRP